MPNPAQLDPLHLAALVGSRLCHDLISPIGAIGNGVELMMMGAANPTGPEMALILESTAAATARVRFFRIAFGMCSVDQRIGRNEVAAVLDDMTIGGRLSVQWDSPADMARRDAKLALLAFSCLESAMPQGGTISAVMSDKGWHIAGVGPRLRIEAALWDGVRNPDLFGDITPGQVHFPLLVLEAARQHRRITVTQTDTELHLTF